VVESDLFFAIVPGLNFIQISLYFTKFNEF
jgi:hypothetical protein